jgi:hypothetical protein
LDREILKENHSLRERPGEALVTTDELQSHLLGHQNELSAVSRDAASVRQLQTSLRRASRKRPPGTIGGG